MLIQPQCMVWKNAVYKHNIYIHTEREIYIYIEYIYIYTMYACVGVCICISTLLPSFYQKIIHSCSIGSTELCCRNCSSSGAASWVLSSNCGIKNWAKPMKIEAFNRKILANPLINQKKWFTNGDSKGTSNFCMRWRYTEWYGHHIWVLQT